MRTREQEYAAKVYAQVKPLADLDKKQRKKYGGMAHKLPILIRTAGLAQALAFVEARGDKEELQHKLLAHIAEVTIQTDSATLLKRSREDNLTAYMHLTQKVLDALLWYKRFAQSVLDVQPGEETGDNE
jgi:CRISPR-associated protein Cmr5